MKEKDIRERIQTFLKETVRYVVVPASMGIGLALVGAAGCGSSESSEKQDGGALYDGAVVTVTTTSTATATDTGGGVLLYQAPMTVSNTGTGTGTATTPVAKYMAVMPDAGLAQPEYMAPQPTATKTSTWTTVAVYSAPMTDTRTKTSTGTGTGTDAKADAGTVEKYSAPIPVDAGKDATPVMPLYAAPITTTNTATATLTTPVLRYMAVMPDAGPIAQPDYMAPLPTSVNTAIRTSLGTGAVALYMAPVPGVGTGGK